VAVNPLPLKESIMKRSISVACLLIFTLSGARAWASDPIGIYALVDRVVIEPSDSQPERIQIWGAFSVAMRQFGDQYSPPVRGYLYYQLPPEKTQAAKAEWADMQKVAGTGQIIAFGSRYQQFGKIRRGAGPVVGRDVNEKDVAALIAQLDEQEQSRREAATEDLKRLGSGAEPKLRAALASTSTSAEAKTRIERVLADLQPDPYPVAFGLARIRADQSSDHVKLLRTFSSGLFSRRWLRGASWCGETHRRQHRGGQFQTQIFLRNRKRRRRKGKQWGGRAGRAANRVVPQIAAQVRRKIHLARLGGRRQDPRPGGGCDFPWEVTEPGYEQHRDRS